MGEALGRIELPSNTEEGVGDRHREALKISHIVPQLRFYDSWQVSDSGSIFRVFRGQFPDSIEPRNARNTRKREALGRIDNDDSMIHGSCPILVRFRVFRVFRGQFPNSIEPRNTRNTRKGETRRRINLPSNTEEGVDDGHRLYECELFDHVSSFRGLPRIELRLTGGGVSGVFGSSSRCSIQHFRSFTPSPSRKARRTQRVTQ